MSKSSKGPTAKRRNFTCNLCPKSYTTKSGLTTHYRRLHSKDKPIKCSVCDFEAVFKFELKLHTAKQHSQENAPYDCSYCKKPFWLRSWLTKHENSVHRRTTTQPCPFCKHIATSKGNLYSHVKNKHRNESQLLSEGQSVSEQGHPKINKLRRRYNLRCNKCDYKAKSEQFLKFHNLVCHQAQVFECSSCNFECKTKSSLKTHQLTHSNIKPFKCGQCDYAAKHKNYLQKHLKIHSEEKKEKNYVCTYCKNSFSMLHDLKIHTTTAHLQIRGYSCPFCSYSATTAKSIKIHVRTSHRHRTEISLANTNTEKLSDTPITVVQYQCKLCSYSSSSKQFFDFHDFVYHKSKLNEKKPLLLQCMVCNSKHNSNYKLKKHMLIHTGLKPFKCNECDFASVQKGNLVKHKRSHTGEKLYHCELCKKSYCSKVGLESHYRTHTGEKPFSCPKDGCSYKSACESNVRLHLKIHKGKRPFQCTMCNHSTIAKSTLQIHFRSVHMKERRFQCNFCSKCLASSAGLIKHIRIHTGEKPYCCNHEGCSYSTGDDGAFRRHLIDKHTEEKPHGCNICSFRTKRASILRKHMDRHTKGQ